MYSRRIKIFVIIIAALLLAYLVRLVEMQLLSHSSLQYEIAKLKDQKGCYRQLKTVRGKILDRKQRTLANDEPRFLLDINYKLTCLMDERVQQAELLKAAKQNNPALAVAKTKETLRTKLEDLQQIIDKCTRFGPDRTDIENKIRNINDSIWNLCTYLAWKRNYPNQDFAQAVPDANERLWLTSQIDIAEMHQSWPLLELKTDDDIFTAQLEFMNTDGVQILPQAHRVYPYNSVAAQTIGWVGPEQEKKLFSDDQLSSYREGELSGRRPGVEYVCETILRGRRGEVFTNIDGQQVHLVRPCFGKDICLTLDIKLQERIENYLGDWEYNPNFRAPTAVVVINAGSGEPNCKSSQIKTACEPEKSQSGADVAPGDILALVSMPTYDLNTIRKNYSAIDSDTNEPLINRAINKQYPPGSVIKPLILIAGLESGKITPDEVINCPAQEAPKGWPSCWLYNRYRVGHDDKWTNNAHNAVKGSCNIYFSRLADRIDPSTLQWWLFRFGYGRKILSPPAAVQESESVRGFLQAQGQISDSFVTATISDFNDIPSFKSSSERRFFGIGQGNLRVTPLQVANAMATIARGGLYKPPRLFMDDQEPQSSHDVDLNISPQTLNVVYDGTSAVVNEPGGTAYGEFEQFLTRFAEQDVKIYGKTGSTEAPDNAWFGGFAKDSKGRGIAIAVVVEGGQHGAQDAAPLARDIIQFCIEAGYIGQTTN
jgi:penicillin-binding protein 2